MNHIQKTRAQFFAGIVVLVVALFSAHFVFAQNNQQLNDTRQIISGQVVAISGSVITIAQKKGAIAESFGINLSNAKITKDELSKHEKRTQAKKNIFKKTSKKKLGTTTVRVGDFIQVIGNSTGDSSMDADRVVIKGSKIKSNN